jgi:hypothetical protein
MELYKPMKIGQLVLDKTKLPGNNQRNVSSDL